MKAVNTPPTLNLATRRNLQSSLRRGGNDLPHATNKSAAVISLISHTDGWVDRTYRQSDHGLVTGGFSCCPALIMESLYRLYTGLKIPQTPQNEPES